MSRYRMSERSEATIPVTQQALQKLLRDGIDRGELAAKNQHTFTHEQARERLHRWQKTASAKRSER